MILTRGSTSAGLEIILSDAIKRALKTTNHHENLTTKANLKHS